MEAGRAGVDLESFPVISDRSRCVALLGQFMRHELVHASGIWSHHGQAQHGLRSQIGMNAVGSVEDLRIRRRQCAEYVRNACRLVQIACPGIQLDEFHARLNLDLLLFYIGEGFRQVCAGIAVVAGALFCHAEKRLNFPPAA